MTDEIMMSIASLISEVSVTPVRPKNTLVAFCSFVYRKEFYLGDIALHIDLSGDGYRLAYPEKTLFNGTRCQIIFPLSSNIGDAIKNVIVTKYEGMIR